MRAKTPRSDRRADPLTRERIVGAAIAILDTQGESALTFRALAARLATGSGAIYWHVADKNALLSAATDHLLGHGMLEMVGDAAPEDAIRAIALAVFDAFDAHPWIGAQLARESLGSAMLQVFEGIGGQLLTLGVPERVRFDTWSALVNYILGVAGQNAANARLFRSEAERTALLASVASRWAQLDPSRYPFLHQVAARLPEHDDREQFLAGIDLILAGIETVR